MSKSVPGVFKRPLFWIISAVVIIAAVIALIFALNGKPDGKKYVGTEIVFDGSYDISQDKSAEFVYDAEALGVNIPAESRVLYKVITDDFGIAAALGFDENGFTEADGARVYSDAGSGAELKVDSYGRFSYKPGKTDDKPQKTDKERFEYINAVIADCGLDLYFSGDWSSSGNVVKGEDGKDTVVTTVMYLSPNADTDGSVTADINPDGSIAEIRSDVLRYESTDGTDLISIDEAIKRLKNGKGRIVKENESVRLEFEEFTLKYLPQETADGDRMLQPVFEFTGTSVSPNGETESFVAVVQANKF